MDQQKHLNSAFAAKTRKTLTIKMHLSWTSPKLRAKHSSHLKPKCQFCALSTTSEEPNNIKKSSVFTLESFTFDSLTSESILEKSSTLRASSKLISTSMLFQTPQKRLSVKKISSAPKSFTSRYRCALRKLPPLK